MNFLSVHNLQSLEGPEREHLEALDETISALLSRSLAVASAAGLNQDHFLKATVTVLLTAAARQALEASERHQETLNRDAFRCLSEEVLRWSQLRLANNRNPGAAENRRHRRLWPRNPSVKLITEGGQECPAKLIDISISGAALRSETFMPVGAKVTIGQTVAHVVRAVRRVECMLAVEFARPLDIEAFDESATL